MTDMTSYYKQAVKDGWKPDNYDLVMEFKSIDYHKMIGLLINHNNDEVTINLKILKNGKELDSGELWNIIQKVQEINEVLSE